MAVGDINSNAVGSGARYNDGKVPYELVPTHLLENTAKVFGYGMRKYAAWNWAKGMKYSVVIGCIKRHLAAIERGEDLDPESGLPHTGHIGCNLMMLEHYMKMYPELDDRPKEWFGIQPSEESEKRVQLPDGPTGCNDPIEYPKGANGPAGPCHQNCS
jgi:hypothetical protein